jgi:protein-tyrosine phosphatase
MPSILFVCTANLYRSPLAAAFFHRKLEADRAPGHWVVESAGTWAVPGRRVRPDLLRAAGIRGIDLSGHVTRRADEDLLARYDLILVMEKGHREALQIEFPATREKLHLLSEVVDRLEYDIQDPAASHVPVEELAEQMCNLIDRAYPRICLLAQPHEIGSLRPRRHVNVTL